MTKVFLNIGNSPHTIDIEMNRKDARKFVEICEKVTEGIMTDMSCYVPEFDDEEAPDLDPCPFCGGEGERMQYSSDYVAIKCASCGAGCAAEEDIDFAPERTWNTRYVADDVVLAVTKQVPMPAKTSGDVMTCPSCKTKGVIFKGRNYCSKCGQKLIFVK